MFQIFFLRPDFIQRLAIIGEMRRTLMLLFHSFILVLMATKLQNLFENITIS